MQQGIKVHIILHISNDIVTHFTAIASYISNTSFTRVHLPGLAQFGLTWLDKNPRVNGQKTKLFQTELAGKNNQATWLYTVRFGSVCLMLYERKAMPQVRRCRTTAVSHLHAFLLNTELNNTLRDSATCWATQYHRSTGGEDCR